MTSSETASASGLCVPEANDGNTVERILPPAPSAPSQRKRPLTTTNEGERLSKRRRLGQASVVCMRELFRTLVNDGDISEDKRVVLQNAGLLLSQIDGKTWVNFPDSEGELRELETQQLRHLRPFLTKVADELRAREINMLSGEGHEQVDCLELADVPWADGITTRELIACCSPDEELQFNAHPLLKALIRTVPSRYMLKSRVKEMANYYYLQGAARTPRHSDNHSLRHTILERTPSLANFVSLVLSACLSGVRYFVGTIAAGIRRGRATLAPVSSMVTAFVVMVATSITGGVARFFKSLPLGDQPVWQLSRLFFAVLLQGQLKKFLQLIVLIARLRVILCLSKCNDFFGCVFFPFTLVARKVLGWNEGSWLLGCSCDSSQRLSLLSLCPVRAAEALFACLKAVRFVVFMPGLGFLDVIVEPALELLDHVQPLVTFVFDLMFSVGFAEGLAMIATSVDRQAHHKLVWMSMSVARSMRDGPSAEPAEISSAQKGSEQRSSDGSPGRSNAEGTGGDNQPPTWREDGAWSLFE